MSILDKELYDTFYKMIRCSARELPALTSLAQQLLKKGADPSIIVSDFGRDSVLHMVMNSINNDILDILKNNLIKITNINVVVNRGQTALLYAAWHDFTSGVNWLLSMGAKDIPDTDDYTAIYHAALRGYTDTVKILLKCGVNPEGSSDNFFSKRSYTSPLIEACCAGHDGTAMALVEHGAKVHKDIKRAVLMGGSETLMLYFAIDKEHRVMRSYDCSLSTAKVICEYPDFTNLLLVNYKHSLLDKVNNKFANGVYNIYGLTLSFLAPKEFVHFEQIEEVIQAFNNGINRILEKDKPKKQSVCCIVS